MPDPLVTREMWLRLIKNIRLAHEVDAKYNGPMPLREFLAKVISKGLSGGRNG
jgi:hypothetical protein